ncbi:MAG TPA: DUF6443 domain-containing protein [Cyclobacteriaceae bacterium]
MNRLSQRISQVKAGLFALLFSLISLTSWAANIVGPATVGVGSVQTYTYTTTGMILQNPKWTFPKGTISTSVSGNTYTATITFTSTGTAELVFQHLNGTLATMYITVNSCPAMTAPVAVNGSHCGPGTVLLSATYTGGYMLHWYAASAPTTLLYNGDDQYYTTPSLTTTTNYLVSKFYPSTGCESSKTSVTASILPMSANAGPDQIGTSTCGLTSVTLAGTGAGSWSVLNGTSGSFGNASSATSTFSGAAGAAYSLRWTQTSGTCPGTDDVNITFNIKPTVAATTLSPLCSGTAGSITITNPNNIEGTAFSWTTTFNNAEITPTTTSPGATISATYYNTDKLTTGTVTHTITPYTSLCTGTPITNTVTVNNTPTAPSPGFQMAYASSLAFFQIQVPAGLESRWYASSTAPTTLANSTTTGTYQNTSVSDPDSYYVSFRDATTLCESPRVLISVTRVAKSAPASFKTEVIRVTGQTTSAAVSSLDNNTQKGVTIIYQDGLGRAIQQITQKATANASTTLQYDIIQPIEYDAFGRSPKTYLPYTKNNTTAYQDTYATDQAAFYTATGDKVANDAAPFAGTAYELSPLGRPLEQSSVGQDWQLGTTHTTKITYSYNAIANNSDTVWIMKADPLRVVTGVQKYADNTLTRLEQTSPDGQKTVLFQNALGQTVVSKSLLNGIIKGNTVAYLCTYYVYDDMNKLRFVIPPAGYAAWKANGWVMTTTIQDQHLYQFVYDARGRLTQKKTPGQTWIYYAYDNLNRPVLMQDANLRASNKWSFTKYDQLGRIVITGLYTNNTQTDLTSIQTLLSSAYTNTATPRYEIQGTTLYGYSNQSFPTANANASALEVLAITYYDDYDFDNDGSANFIYDNADLTGLPSINSAYIRGQATGSRKLILGTTNWITSAAFYDDNGRVIQLQSNNHLNLTGIDKRSVLYDFEGKVVQTKNYHNGGGTNVITTVQTPVYHNTGRVTGLKYSINGATDQLVSQYQYNDLGQVVTKQLHNTSGTTFLQNVDYRYTINGQLESINNAQLTNDGGVTNTDTNDYFGMELLYNKTESSGLGNTPLYSGSASAVKWKAMDNTGTTAGQRSYTFAYDKTDKLVTSTYKKYGTTAWDQEVNTQNETMNYDHNGNILSLQRNQNQRGLSGHTITSTAQTIDNLTYTYGRGNKLTKVTDASANVAGFTDGANVANEYVYDTLGNVTKDLNKGMSSITYNILGKVQTITFTDGRTITYQYDASGAKLKMTTTISGTTTATDYANGFVYTNSALSYFSSPEGRIVKNGSNYEYQYSIADHQGNTRVVFTSATAVQIAPVATFESDTNDNASQYLNATTNIVSFTSANHTTSGSKVVKMNQTYKLGPAKTLSVFPGDKVDMEVWEYHEGSSGYGTTSTPLTTLITSVAGQIGGTSGGVGDAGLKYNGVSSALNNFGTGGNQGDARPAAYLNYILFDKNYKVLDAGWQVAPSTTFTKQKLSFNTLTIKEPGYVYVYLSYDDDSNNWVYFDDFKVTYTPTNVIQYNEYYPFGLQTTNSWTRDNNNNNMLYNAGSELNTTSGIYDLPYRNYDATLGRFFQVDPLAHKDHSVSPFAYAGNNPVIFNDPSGLLKATPAQFWAFVEQALNGHGGVWSEDGGQHLFGSEEEQAAYVADNPDAVTLKEGLTTVFVPDPGGKGGGLNVSYMRLKNGSTIAKVNVKGSSSVLYETTLLHEAEFVDKPEGEAYFVNISGAELDGSGLHGWGYFSAKNFGEMDMMASFWQRHGGIRTLVIQSHASYFGLGLQGPGNLTANDLKKNTLFGMKFKALINRIEQGGTLALLGCKGATNGELVDAINDLRPDLKIIMSLQQVHYFQNAPQSDIALEAGLDGSSGFINVHTGERYDSIILTSDGNVVKSGK